MDPAPQSIAEPLAPPAMQVPPQVAQSRASECVPTLLGKGSRMEVYPLVDERTVLRVPRRTEQQLIDAAGSSGRKVLSAGHQVSRVTERELRDLEKADSFIGAFLPGTTPFADVDLNGDFRYYSLQRRVKITLDLRVCTTPMPTATSRRSLERFIRDVRDMVTSVALLPDLAGRGNLVLDGSGLVKLIDINNFRRLVPDEEIARSFPADEALLDELALGRKDVRDYLPRDYLDDLGNPIGDLSLAALQTLEMRGLGADPSKVDADPFYTPLRNERRRLVLALLHGDLA
jgi:hypothetical protein